MLIDHLLQKVAIVLLAALPLTADAQSMCNPPPPGLDYNTWFSVCQSEINFEFQTRQHNLPWERFVPELYNLYINYVEPYQPTACSPDGQTYCNSSGWQMTCTNGQWLTGAVQC